MESEIRNAVQGLRDQGSSFAVVVRDSEEKIEFSIRPPESERPSTVGVLSPGYPFYLEELNGRAQRLPRGSQVFVPVDREAEQALHGLKKSLEYLPKDMQSLVWHALLMPSLDARIDRLEMEVRGRTAGQELKPIGLGERLAGWLRKPVVYWSALALALVALLGFGGYQAYRFLRAPAPAAAPAPPDPAIAEVARRIAGIFRTMEAKKKGSRELTKLAKAHQSDLHGTNTDKIARLFTEKPSEELDRLLLVLIKLQVLKLQVPKLGQEAPDITFLDEPHSLSPTMAALASIDPEIVAKDAVAQDLLASLSCRFLAAQPENPPLLPEAGVSGKPCKAFPLTKALPGLKAIPAFIDEYAAAAPPPATPPRGN